MDENNKNKRKSQLIFITIIAVIALFLIGIIYQFVCIKKLERDIERLENQLNGAKITAFYFKDESFLANIKKFDKKYEYF